MKKILLVAKRDFIASVRTKAFVFSLVAAPVLFGGSFIGLALIRGKPDIKERRIAIVDHTGAVAAAVIDAARERNLRELRDKVTGERSSRFTVSRRRRPTRQINARSCSLCQAGFAATTSTHSSKSPPTHSIPRSNPATIGTCFRGTRTRADWAKRNAGWPAR